MRAASIALVATAALAVSCGGGAVRPDVPATAAFSSAALVRTMPEGGAPAWTVKETEVQNGRVIFVGLSTKDAAQQGARDAAEKHARSRVAAYVGSQISERWQKLSASYGLASGTVDPTVAQRGMQEIATSALVSKFKIDEWYIEMWGVKATGAVEYYIVYGRGSIAEADVDRAIVAAAEKAKAQAAEWEKRNTELQAALAEAQALVKDATEDKRKGFPDRAERKFQDALTKLAAARGAANAAGMADRVGQIGQIDQLTKAVEELRGAQAGPMGLASAVEALAEAVGAGPVTVAVASATWQDTTFGSPVASWLVQLTEEELMRRAPPFRVIPNKVFTAQIRSAQLSLEAVRTSAEAAGKLLPKPDALLTISYWQKADGLQVSFQIVKAGEGTGIGAATAMMPAADLPAGIEVQPTNRETAEGVMEAFGRAAGTGTPAPGALAVKTWPDRGESATYREGDEIVFNVQATRDCYVYLFHADAEGNVDLLFPNKFQAANQIKGGALFTLPWAGATFKFRARPPFGSEVVEAVATTEPVAELQAAVAKGAFRSLGTAGSEVFRGAMAGIGRLPDTSRAASRCTLTIVPGTAAATGGPRPVLNLAVANLAPQNVGADDAAGVSDMLRAEVAKTKAFRLLERARMEQVMAEQALQQTGATDSERAVQLGKLLNVQRMVVGSFGRLGGVYVVTIQAVDVESGEVVHGDSLRGRSMDEVLSGLAAMATRLAREAR
ncbi:MAG: DUF4384 domain-containing protein [Candidatus Coatesbacteria bacterium]